MKAIFLSFMQMLRFVRRDKMLFAACIAPLLVGVFFKLAIPAIERTATQQIGAAAILLPYYGLFDVFFSMLAPVMFCFVTAMVILEEHDDHIDSYLFITALGRKGYLISRIGIPAGIAFIITAALLPVFKLTALSVLEIIFLSLTGALQGVIMALLIVTISTNKLEGMAVTKLSTLLILGALAPYFVQHPIQYVLSFLPSFWIGKAIHGHSLVYLLVSIPLMLVWIGLLLKKFLRKIS